MVSARVPRFLSCLLAVFFVAVMTGCGGSHDRVLRVFSTTLSSVQEVPPNASPAVGAGIVTVDLDTLMMTASVTVSNVNGTAAYLAEGPPGFNGAVLLPMSKAGVSVWSGSAFISSDQLRTLRRGGSYFNVASVQFPGGEIRGQLVEDLPTPEEWAQLQQARAQSAQLDQQLRLVEDADFGDGHFSGIGFGFTLGF